MLTDTHAHLNFPDFAEDLKGVLERAAEAGVHRVVTIGTSIEGSREAVALAERYPQVWATVGIHPNSASETSADYLPELRALAKHPKVVALGEIGLDYFRLPSSQDPSALAQDAMEKERQAQVFREQLALAEELDLNVVIHQRASWDDTLAILHPYGGRIRAVYHCFGEPIERARQILELGHLVSFTGIVTFKNAAALHDTVAKIPPGTFMVETDCPYLAPVPHRGQRCEPAHTRMTAERVALLRDAPLEAVGRETEAVADAFFRFDR